MFLATVIYCTCAFTTLISWILKAKESLRCATRLHLPRIHRTRPPPVVPKSVRFLTEDARCRCGIGLHVVTFRYDTIGGQLDRALTSFSVIVFWVVFSSNASYL